MGNKGETEEKQEETKGKHDKKGEGKRRNKGNRRETDEKQTRNWRITVETDVKLRGNSLFILRVFNE